MQDITIPPGQTVYFSPMPVRELMAWLSVLVECTHAHGIVVLVSNEPEPPEDVREWYRRDLRTGMAANMYNPPNYVLPIGAMRWVMVGVMNHDGAATAHAKDGCEVVT
jgi:uncharacterized membrane protein